MKNERNENHELKHEVKYEAKCEMKCEVIRDLLPSYMEKLTSPVSNQLVEDHLKSCADCRRYASEMSAEADASSLAGAAAAGGNAAGTDSRAHDIKPFRKLKKKMWRNILLAVLACALVFGGCTLYFTHSWAPDFDDVTMTCEMNGDVATLTFTAKDENVVLSSYIGVFCSAEAADDSDECVELVATRKNPFTTPLRKNAYYGYTFIDENTVYNNNTGKPITITDDSYFLVMFGDKSVKIKIKDLAKEKVTILE